MTPKVSVIIPIYNSEKYLKRCIDSVINQTLKEIEIICINDGSKDNSVQILNNYSKKDDRIIIINQENSGPGVARNNGIEHSNGDYIFFLDSDDYISKNALNDLLLNAYQHNSDLVLFKRAMFDDKKTYYNYPIYDFKNENNFINQTFTYKNVKKYVINDAAAPFLKLYKKNLIKNASNAHFATHIKLGEDIIFNAKVFLNAKRISYLPEYLYFYKLNEDSITHNLELYVDDVIQYCNDVLIFFKENNLEQEFKNELDSFIIKHTITHLFYTTSEEYFNNIKKMLKKIKLNKNNTLLEKSFIRKYNLVLKSDNCHDFLINYYKNEYEITSKEFESIFNTFRLDIKNSGNNNNFIELLENSDDMSNVSCPSWFNNETGKGTVIESSKGEINLKIKCHGNGNLNFSFKGVDFRDSQNLKIPILINLTNLTINGVTILDKNTIVHHNQSFDYTIKGQNNEIVYIYAKWKPINIKQKFFYEKDNSLNEIFKICRFDIKNNGKNNNYIELLENSDKYSSVSCPLWFSDERGIGMVIES